MARQHPSSAGQTLHRVSEPHRLPDAETSALRRQVLRRARLVRQRTRMKNQMHAILHRNLIPRCPAADLFGHKGCAWLVEQDLPPDEQAAAGALLRQLDFHGEELRLLDTALGQVGLGRPEVLRLMTVPGIDATVALSIVAAVGDFTRFRTGKAGGLSGAPSPGPPVRRPTR
jgi:transposase